MRLTVVGCSGSMPGPHSPASCYLLEADGFRLVVDLGNGALGGLQRYTALNRVDAVALSHLHADHCLDMCPLWVARTYSYEGALPRIPVYGPASAAELAASADVLLCEAGFPELPDLPPDLHLCGRQAGEHAARAGAGRLIVTHLDPDNNPAQSLAAAAGTFSGPVSLAAPGQVLDLG
jgi:ribonuclease BN (tRNA processing enzyme)